VERERRQTDKTKKSHQLQVATELGPHLPSEKKSAQREKKKYKNKEEKSIAIRS